MDIAILLFDGITSLDAIGPYEVLSRLLGANVRFVAETAGLKRTDNGMLAMNADFTLADVPAPEIMVIPGGFGQEAVMQSKPALDWVRRAHETTLWTTSVCTGSLILAAAGVLKGVRATSHWSAMARLAELGAIPTDQRVVREGRIVTAAGVSAGIDMALTLAAEIDGEERARAIQLGIEYDPKPPFDAGSVPKSDTVTIAFVRNRGLRQSYLSLPIEIREERMDSPAAKALIREELLELDVRYPDDHGVYTPPRPEEFVAPHGTFLVVRIGGRPVGCGGLRRFEGKEAEIKRMYVQPWTRKRGLARKILVALEDAARRLGYQKIRLETGLRQPEAIGLYESAAYLPIPPYGEFARSPLSVCYQKTLG